MQNNNVAILILSCDKYADIWEPFYYFFFKYWNNCPYSIYHASNYKKQDDRRIKNIQSNQLTNWSAETKNILKQIKEQYVIVILEDYFIYQIVDQVLLTKSIEEMILRNALFLKLGTSPSMYNSFWKYDVIKEKPFIAKIRNGEKYKVNLQVGIWNKQLLENIIIEGESPWEFEINASIRSNELSNPCLCLVEDSSKNYVHGPITYLCTALSKGVWMRDAIELCKQEGLSIKTEHRKIETRFEYFFRKLYTKTPLSRRKYLDFIKNKFFNFQYQ